MSTPTGCLGHWLPKKHLEPSMLFNSTNFLQFFALVYPIYLLLISYGSIRLRNAFLLFASYVFYGAWDFKFLLLILLSTLIDYSVATLLDITQNTRTRKILLWSSVVTNLGVLAYFKYADFGIESFAELLKAFGFEAHYETLNIILPVGISFYTFQTLGYVIDVYRRQLPACRDLGNFALFVAFFPQLVAGPIEQAKHLIPQVEGRTFISRQDLRIGTLWIFVGFFKKVVIADSLAPFVNEAFSHPENVSGIVSLIAIFSFALQIYGDFAGYSLIARGVARIMGFHLVQNFNAPYLATSIRDFWHRWHISLSLWLRHYLYYSLGGNKQGKLTTYRNLFLTMLLGGLWHGAAWNFALWGAYHGVLLVVERLIIGDSPSAPRSLSLRILAILRTFVLVTFGWLLFRVESLNQFAIIVYNIVFNFRWEANVPSYLLATISCSLLLFVYHSFQERFQDELILLRLNVSALVGIYTFILLCLWAVGFRPIPFIYFQF